MGLPKGIALIIGVSQYYNPLIGDLETAIHDARSMSACFRDCLYDVRCLENPNVASIRATLRIIRTEIVSYRCKHIFIYYAGRSFSNSIAHYLILSEFLSSNGVRFEDELSLNAFKLEDLIRDTCKDIPFSQERVLVVILDTYHGLAGLEQDERSDGKLLQQRNILDLSYYERTGFLVNHAEGNAENGPGLYTKLVLKELRIPGVTIINAISKANQLLFYISNGTLKPHMEINFPHMFNFFLGEYHHSTMEDYFRARYLR